MKNSLVLEKRTNKLISFFEEDFFPYFFEQNKFLTEIVFFGSFIKGNEKENSDLDIILVVSPEFLERNIEGMDKIETLLRLHQDLEDGLNINIPLDVKLQEFINDEEQYGWTYRTGNIFADFYSFIKGEVGQMAILKRNQSIQFEKR